MGIVKIVNQSIRRFGASIERYPNRDLKRKMLLFKHFKINKIFDVGASIGHYTKTLREIGYKGEIVSFEPLANKFKTLAITAKNDANWTTLNIALGNKDEETFINVAGGTGMWIVEGHEVTTGDTAS